MSLHCNPLVHLPPSTPHSCVRLGIVYSGETTESGTDQTSAASTSSERTAEAESSSSNGKGNRASRRAADDEQTPPLPNAAPPNTEVNSIAKQDAVAVLSSANGVPTNSSHSDTSRPLVALDSAAIGPVKGLQNLGNTCFFNSVLQNIVQTAPLKHYLFTRAAPPAIVPPLQSELSSLVRRMWATGSEAVEFDSQLSVISSKKSKQGKQQHHFQPGSVSPGNLLQQICKMYSTLLSHLFVARAFAIARVFCCCCCCFSRN